ncbi:DUF732 domain-containing protein [Mycolicibacterium fluoranthenivorans]|uniref:DUF732 domain-containing protein n=1 Tax=Mycolicibacterium fluoranthenivorans TaxID=258505 RepID=A0A7G8PAS3_9MYCO|nr:DUF732 domain-containing protein [Mycolicibacterium fluoranthenivorans]QNJ91439.1 DUF732 domain-containing protein [Mycolicibacterium fluoranthenivorans]
MSAPTGDEPIRDYHDALLGAQTELAPSASETEAHTAWALDDEPELRQPFWTPGRITAVAVVSAVLVVVAVAGLAGYHLRDEPGTPAAPPSPSSASVPSMTIPMVVTAPPTTTTTTTTPPLPVLAGADGRFIEKMRSYGVPVSDQDPQWTVDLARAICGAAKDNGPVNYPPGMHTVLNFTDGIMEKNPDWSWQQASRFTDSAVDAFCPWLRGPSPQEIAAMPPDERYLALLQDRIGITRVDDSLVNAAHQICIWKTQGWRNDQAVDAIDSPNPRDEEARLVEIAISVYCPEFADR